MYKLKRSAPENGRENRRDGRRWSGSTTLNSLPHPSKQVNNELGCVRIRWGGGASSRGRRRRKKEKEASHLIYFIQAHKQHSGPLEWINELWMRRNEGWRRGRSNGGTTGDASGYLNTKFTKTPLNPSILEANRSELLQNGAFIYYICVFARRGKIIILMMGY